MSKKQKQKKCRKLIDQIIRIMADTNSFQTNFLQNLIVFCSKFFRLVCLACDFVLISIRKLKANWIKSFHQKFSNIFENQTNYFTTKDSDYDLKTTKTMDRLDRNEFEFSKNFHNRVKPNEKNSVKSPPNRSQRKAFLAKIPSKSDSWAVPIIDLELENHSNPPRSMIYEKELIDQDRQRKSQRQCINLESIDWKTSKSLRYAMISLLSFSLILIFFDIVLDFRKFFSFLI